MTDFAQTLQLALGDAYRLERELPGGGMSRVFLAIEASLNRQVVIKVLPPEFTSEVSAARFKQEMEFTARLQHPHILPVLAAGARDGLLYYVMPFVSGESLRRYFEREGRLGVQDAMRLLHEIADALAFAHGHGVIHRDIKPENVLLEGKHAVLADFGIARALVESRTGDRLTATGMAIGTPGYMSPEQLSGGDIDARTDVYALAVVAYEMLAGTPPFTGPTAQAVLAAHLTKAPTPLHEVRPDVPRAISDVIGRALSKEMSDRFASAGEFGEALQAAAPPTSGSREPMVHRSRPPFLKSRIVLPLLAVAVAALLVVRVATQRAESRALRAAVGAAADSGDFDTVARLLGDASVDLGDGALTELVPRIAGFLAVRSNPSNAAVVISRVTPIEQFLERPLVHLGRTPLEHRPVVVGEYLVTYAAPGHDSLSLLVNVTTLDSSALAADLVPSDTSAPMVLVRPGPGDSAAIDAPFLIARHETTNAEFQRFVDAGGYRSPEYWPESMVIEGRATGRQEALARLVDGTGLAGPRGWTAGRFPEGKGQHPVAGVTWYEAHAYARWARGALPTAAQWWLAALGGGAGPFPWGRDGSTIEARANFSLTGTTEAGAHPLGVSPFGVHDMAGNVGEWLADRPRPGNQRMVAGGSWRDPTYLFERGNTVLVDAGAASDIVGFRIVTPAPGITR
ncbi:MAG TPA: bifunctional serine/threonine-protein kinase/formylglycine-generating enzyme family protein [Gemmatimonadaceae bacterium]|nr:bifunctional serine/threonine-protein kinase/formylglycine-generating enzyme family protein [Gemmatimonadaceae bacterium]